MPRHCSRRSYSCSGLQRKHSAASGRIGFPEAAHPCHLPRPKKVCTFRLANVLRDNRSGQCSVHTHPIGRSPQTACRIHLLVVPDHVGIFGYFWQARSRIVGMSPSCSLCVSLTMWHGSQLILPVAFPMAEKGVLNLFSTAVESIAAGCFTSVTTYETSQKLKQCQASAGIKQ